MSNYKPVKFKKFEEEALKNSKVRTAYNKLEAEYALMVEMIERGEITRKKQQEVATKIHTSKVCSHLANKENL